MIKGDFRDQHTDTVPRPRWRRADQRPGRGDAGPRSRPEWTARFATHLPLEGQGDLWHPNPDVLLVPGLIPAGQADEADGGHHLEGRWNYVSGVEFADWALIAAPTSDKSRFFAVPRKDFDFECTWDAVGMRATGSHTLRVSGAFVPHHRSVSFSDVMAGINHVSRA